MKRVIHNSMKKKTAENYFITLSEVADFLSQIPELQKYEIDFTQEPDRINITVGDDIYTLVGAL
ncbi:hypothetical protein [Lachnoclostridium sp. MSJ-17]|uniref:hypothetical protein n=1 Tax=Lachnoclostridium sp. MSJ-17 TaxID=2841516 RepID=UPI001C114823|nr:hypothetical protein [Lachnoclostridium sp. MSJ-17]MBU5462456.1 hypothetical protein [Lachnoclostridium sp. MSJ-17]